MIMQHFNYIEFIFKVKKVSHPFPSKFFHLDISDCPSRYQLTKHIQAKPCNQKKKNITVKYQSILFFLYFFYQEGVSQNH